MLLKKKKRIVLRKYAGCKPIARRSSYTSDEIV
jgi:hypothetical protein